MQAGSLVVTIQSTSLWIRSAIIAGISFSPNPPSPDQVYTCKRVFPSPFDESITCIELEEISMIKEPDDIWTFMKADVWREIQPPMIVEIEDLMPQLETV